MLESKIEHKIGREKCYYIYAAIEFFRAFFGLALFTFAGVTSILCCPVILGLFLMPWEKVAEEPIIEFLKAFALVALVCFVLLYALLGVEKLLFSKATIQKFEKRMLTVCPAQFESRKVEETKENWIKVTPETMPPERVPVIATIVYDDNKKKCVQTEIRWNPNAGWECLVNSRDNIWAAVGGNVTYWMPTPDPADM